MVSAGDAIRRHDLERLNPMICPQIARRANQKNLSSPSAKNFPLALIGQISGISPPVSPDKRGGSRSSRTRGGMRWTRRLRLTSVADADGEVVWAILWYSVRHAETKKTL